MDHQFLAWLQCLAHCLGLVRAVLGAPSLLQPPSSPYSPPCKSMASTLVCPLLLPQLALYMDCSPLCSLAASGLVYLLVQQMVAAQSMLHRVHLQHSPQSRSAASTLVCPLWLQWQHTAVLQAVFLRLQLQHQRHPLHPLVLPPPLKGSGHRALLPLPQPLLFSLGNSSLSNSSNNRGLALPPLTLPRPHSLFEGFGRRDSPLSSHLLQCQLSLFHSTMSNSRAQLLTAS